LQPVYTVSYLVCR